MAMELILPISSTKEALTEVENYFTYDNHVKDMKKLKRNKKSVRKQL